VFSRCIGFVAVAMFVALQIGHKIRNIEIKTNMLATKTAHRRKNGHTNGHANGHSTNSSRNGTGLPYFTSLRRTVVSQFQTPVFGLKQDDAEKCADTIMKVIVRNHKRARIAGLVK
jgi:hypothetical protein